MKNHQLLKEVFSLLREENFVNRNKTSARVFVRTRVLTFQLTSSLLIQMVSQSMGLYLGKYLSRLKERFVSKQAFSKARYQIRPQGITELNDRLIDLFYSRGDYESFLSTHIVVASDATTLRLPGSDEMIAEFSQMDNDLLGEGVCCLAKCIKLYDPINDMTLYSGLHSYDCNEPIMFEQALPKLETFAAAYGKRVLLLGDRAYPSFFNMHRLPQMGIDFLFRIKSGHCEEIEQFIASGQRTALIRLDMTIKRRKDALRFNQKIEKASDFPDQLQVRAFHLTAPSGEPCVLVTNLASEVLSDDQLADYYTQRWDIETSFRYDKQALEVERFSAKKPQGIRQEWQAAVLCSNIAQLLITDAQQELDQQQADKTNKYPYQINKRIAIGLVKDRLSEVLNQKISVAKWYQELYDIILRHSQPIRKNRQYKRINKHRTKFNQIYRSIL